MRKLYGTLAAAFLVLCLPALALGAAGWPKSTIKIIVPYTAGGGADLMSRALAPELSKILGVSVVVEDVPGGGGGIAMAKLMRSKPDGYTIIHTTVGAATLTPNSSDVGYTDKEFAPIAQVADVPNVIAVHKDSGIKTLKELFEKAEKENLTYSTSGAGLTQNVQMEALFLSINKPGLLTHVPFGGGSQAMAALLGKQVDCGVAIVPEPLPHIQNGTFTALAITSSERDPALPDVPTMKELGYSLEGGVWYGFAAPAKTPGDVIARLEAAFAQAAKEPAIIETFRKLGNPVRFLGSKEFAAKWKNDFETNKKVLEAMKAQK